MGSCDVMSFIAQSKPRNAAGMASQTAAEAFSQFHLFTLSYTYLTYNHNVLRFRRQSQQ